MTALLRLVESETAGSPMRHRKWVRRSLRHLSSDLRCAGHQASHPTVGHLLREQEYTLRTNVKRFTGPPHPDRDRQFAYIEEQKAAFLAAGLPVISVDTKKKELRFIRLKRTFTPLDQNYGFLFSVRGLIHGTGMRSHVHEQRQDLFHRDL